MVIICVISVFRDFINEIIVSSRMFGSVDNCCVLSSGCRLRSGNACYHSVQNLLSSRLLLKNLKINIYGTIILPVVLYGCETWSLTLREGRKLRVCENMVLRRIFGPR